MATSILDDVLDEAGGELDAAVDLRRRIHQRPELGLDLPETQTAVLESLDGLPLRVTAGAGTTSVVAVLDGDEPGPTVLLRGDMDALPMPEDTGLEYASEVDGAMHACGHDAHVAMLVGAARLLSARRGQMAGRVAFMFQPGEEGHHGAREMLRAGLLDEVAAGAEPVSLAFAIHQSPTIPSGVVATKGQAVMASTNELRITVNGRGGHASMPHHAGDPIPVAAAIVTAIQSMVTRRVDAFDPAVVTITKVRAGTTVNVIPESATMWGTVRALSSHPRAQVLEHLVPLVEGIASAHGMTADVELTEGYPVTVNDDGAARFALDTAAQLLGEGSAVELRSPVMGGEDWSYVLQEVPGAMAFLGTRPPGVAPQAVAPNHSNRMVLDESAMRAGIAMYSAVAARWLSGERPTP
jgi:amidohydrolase